MAHEKRMTEKFTPTVLLPIASTPFTSRDQKSSSENMFLEEGRDRLFGN